MRGLPEIAQGWTGTAVFSTGEERVQGTILWRLLAGNPVAPADLAAAVGLPEADLEPILAELHTRRCLRRDEHGAVVAARGLMLEPSAHRLVTNYGAVYTQCSVDAIGIPAALGIGATIEDQCALCSQPITVIVQGKRVVSVRPADAVVVMAEACGARTGAIPTMCHETNLFCSPLHAQQWRAEQSTLPSAVVSPADAVTVGHAIWGRFAPYVQGM
jgi:hypothetical protein